MTDIINDNFDNLFDIVKENFKEEESPQKKEYKGEFYCNSCNDDTIRNIKGELICIKCSMTYGVNIDNGAEWRYYGSDDSRNSDPNRCGMPSNSLLPEFSLGSVIMYKCNESFEMKKIRNYNTWIGSCYKEKSLFTVFESISMRAKSYGIPQCIIEDAKYKYKEISELKISRGENRLGIIASCLFIACYENNSRRSSKEIAEIFKISPRSMTKGFKKYNEIMLSSNKEIFSCDDVYISDSIDFINRFCSNLNLDQNITDLCYYVCSQIEKYDLVSENTPTSKAAGCIYLISYLFDLEISKKDISNICSTSEVTITKCFIKLIDFYIYLLPEKMLKILAIDFIHKFSQNLIKYYNANVYNSFLRGCIKSFEIHIKNNIINNNRYITVLAGAVTYKNLQKENFSHLNLNDICINFHLKEKNIMDIYNKL